MRVGDIFYRNIQTVDAAHLANPQTTSLLGTRSCQVPATTTTFLSLAQIPDPPYDKFE